MKWLLIVLMTFLFTACDNIGFGSSYPSVYTENVPECGCDGVMYILTNPNQLAQRVTITRIRQSGTASKKRKNIVMTIQPRAEKRLGCSEINLYIRGRSEYCDTHQSFYVKKYRDIKPRK